MRTSSPDSIKLSPIPFDNMPNQAKKMKIEKKNIDHKQTVVMKTKEKLPRQADKIIQQCLFNIEEKNSWLLDVESAAYAKMGCTEVQCSIFELEALQA